MFSLVIWRLYKQIYHIILLKAILSWVILRLIKELPYLPRFYIVKRLLSLKLGISLGDYNFISQKPQFSVQRSELSNLLREDLERIALELEK